MMQSIQSILDTLRAALSFAPPWAVSVVILAGAVVLAWLIHAAILALVRRLLRQRRPYLRSILEATKNPTRIGLLLAAFAIALPTAPLSPETTTVLARCLIVATIFLLGWIAATALGITTSIYLLRFRIDDEDNLLARKHITQVRVLVRVLDTIIVLVTVGLALMSFEEVRQFGVSLFASAGVAGLVAGLAARPVLSNLFAGVQLAITQPIRLEDSVTIENETGTVEEITSTYVVIRLWDLRRLIVPLSYFIEKPFYNWTRQTAANVGRIVLHLDYTAPIDLVRSKAIELADQSTMWRGKVTNVQVVDTGPDTIQVQVLVSAASAAAAGNLCADLRERLINFLSQEYPQALPRRRTEIVDSSPRKTA